MRRVGGAVLAVLVGVLVAACGGEEPAPPAPPPEQGQVELPPRPREVRLDGVDPCLLLTEEQRVELGLDGEPVEDRSPSLLYQDADVPACVIRGFEPRALTVGVSLVATEGIELFSSGGLAAKVQPIEVHGFPALVAVPNRFTDFCTVVVDVASGQLIDVQVATGGRQPPIPQPQLCEDAETVADAAMRTLLRR